MKDRHIKTAVLSTIILSLALACAPASPVGSTAQEVIGGSATTALPAVAALTDPETERAFCSGTLIGCNTVLTAAHCVCSGEDPCVPKAPGDMKVFFQHAGFFDVESFEHHPSYSADNIVYDVAVVHLSEPVTGIDPMPIAAALAPPPGTAITVAGYGRSNRTGIDSGIKKIGTLTSQQCGAGVFPGETSTHHICMDSPNDEVSVCNGDSGGPSLGFIAGEPVVVGVNSYVKNVNVGTENEIQCINPVSANVYSYHSWIQTAAGEPLGVQTCSMLPALNFNREGEDITTEGYYASFPGDDTLAEVEVEVPRGTSEVRLTWNNMWARTLPDGRNVRITYNFTYAANPKAEGLSARASAECDASTRACIVYSPSPGTLTMRLENPSSIGEAQFTVTTVGGAPVAESDRFEAVAGVPLEIAATQGLLANDTVSATRGATATVIARPQSGSLEVSADGSFVYTPSEESVGIDSFTYEVVDDGGYTSEEVVVEIDVTANPDRGDKRSGGVKAGCSATGSGDSPAGLGLFLLLVMGGVVRQRRRHP